MFMWNYLDKRAKKEFILSLDLVPDLRDFKTYQKQLKTCYNRSAEEVNL